MKILFLGGKRILGKSVIKKLIKIKSIELFILNRSKPEKSYRYNKINYLIGDRYNNEFLKFTLQKFNFDIIFDNNCYDFNDFKKSFNEFKTKKNLFYIFTSSVISYLDFTSIKVEQESLKKKLLKVHERLPKKLALNKKKIELFLLSQKKLNFCILKLHNIIGKNDHSNKTDYLKNFNFSSLKRLQIKKSSFLQFAFIEDITNIISILIERIIKKKAVLSVYNIANDPMSYEELIRINSKNKSNKVILDHDIIENIIVDNSRVKKNLRYSYFNNKIVLNKLNKLK